MFHLFSETPIGRRGQLQTQHGPIETPFFLPVATGGAMRGITHEELLSLGAQVLLCNTYHLHLQPGEDVIRSAGGLHSFIGWDKPILTDSGGFQIFSMRHRLKMTDSGVHFRNHLNGDRLSLDPKKAMHIQHTLRADILMCLDQCPPSTAKRPEVEKAVDRTLMWAEECKREHERLKSQKMQKSQRIQKKRDTSAKKSSESSASSDSSESLLFAVIQGGLEPDLRKRCTEELIAMDFDGYAIGGLAVGETPEEMEDILDLVCPMLPKDKPRYLMGVGVREQLKTCVAKGIDMFDCVLPMRIARHGTILLSDGLKLCITNAEFKDAHTPIDPDSPSPLSRKHSLSYLHHLFKAHERLAETIACMQNLGATLGTMQELRRKMETQNKALHSKH